MSNDQRLIYAAAFVRAVAVGLIGVLFALYLIARGLQAAQIGFLVTVGLAGSASSTFLVSFWADRLGRRRCLALLSLCMAVGGIGLALCPSFAALAVACFFGMVNSFGRERGAIHTLEQAILPAAIPDHQRTNTFAWYNVMLDAGLALGSLLGSLPVFLRRGLGVGELASYQAGLFLYSALIALCIFLYACLTPQVEQHGPSMWHQISPATRRTIVRLSVLFGFDSLAGGFLPGSLIAYWFFKRFGVGEELLGPLFFAGHVANAFSHLGAAWLSRRIGLVRTMVFTHTPSSLCLIALPFIPTLPVAILFYIIRECLVEMDLPTRQSYVMAVVEPRERTLASGVTNLTRLAAWAVAPSFAGFIMNSLAVGLPLVIGGSMKILYDALLFRSFHRLHPPEEVR